MSLDMYCITLLINLSLLLFYILLFLFFNYLIFGIEYLKSQEYNFFEREVNKNSLVQRCKKILAIGNIHISCIKVKK